MCDVPWHFYFAFIRRSNLPPFIRQCMAVHRIFGGALCWAHANTYVPLVARQHINLVVLFSFPVTDAIATECNRNAVPVAYTTMAPISSRSNEKNNIIQSIIIVMLMLRPTDWFRWESWISFWEYAWESHRIPIDIPISSLLVTESMEWPANKLQNT